MTYLTFLFKKWYILMMTTELKKINRDSIKKSSIFNITIKLITYLIPLVLSPYLYRTLSFTGVGTFEFQYAYVTYFAMITSFGFDTYGTRRISTASDNIDELSKRFWSIFSAKIILGSFSLITYFLVMLSGSFGKSDTFASYSLLSLFIVSAMTDISFFYQGIEKFKGVALRTVFIKLLNLILIFIFVKTPNDYLKYVAIMGCSYVAASAVMYLPLKKYIKFHNVKALYIKEELKKSSVFFISALAMNLYTTLQKTILGLMTNETQVGYYSSAMKLKDVIVQLCYGIITVYYSRISYLVSQDKRDETLQKTYTCFNAIFDIALPASIGLICVSDVFMPLYFGNDASNAVNMMIFVSLSIPFLAMSLLVSNVYLMPYNKQNKANVAYVSAVFINILLSFIFIKFLGGNGVAIAALISDTYIALLFVHFSKNAINYKTILNKLSKPFLSSLIMAICYYLGKFLLKNKISDNKAMVVLIIFSMILYTTLMIIFKDDFLYHLFQSLKSKAKSILHKKN